ncbi:MAG: hypothetical protein JXR76_21135 [Deltaproteobacteria bacterium]|nr:hypothetical protein [Deltaproteobacteria bacterium]
MSLLKVTSDKNACTACGKCDSVCYIATNKYDFSRYESGKTNLSTHYACSRRLICVVACNKDALSFAPAFFTTINGDVTVGEKQ